MTTDNVRNIGDYKKKDVGVDADCNPVSGNTPPVRLSEKLRNGIPRFENSDAPTNEEKHGL